ncbi:DUF434 domain-containing protein [Roseiconus nitratireducens]|uniref:DUF434 domain-containing protein n=1 Tax=Roseiconus nitratireducens TaxID=2605748 RepID=A0A5M6CW39_9BACT|nr:DUF434 domain-containing protein [Roseiconus nitratireducens]KAA5539448.1 DUF434 domain-containing protein [Roseiconus nitratireducens]
MPDSRQHRGPHPQDLGLFDDQHRQALRSATEDLSWLLSRGYALTSCLKLVGDRYRLRARQRLAVARCACSDEARKRRRRNQIQSCDLAGGELWIDGYNVLTSIEAALAGGVILCARDGCFRDMASMHGSYRKVAETLPALQLLAERLSDWKVARCCWYLDAPVSNSGRLKTLIEGIAEQWGACWEVKLVADPDPILATADQTVASADSQILDVAPRWFNLARRVIEEQIEGAWIVDLSSPGKATVSKQP